MMAGIPDRGGLPMHLKSGSERIQELLERRARYEALEKALVTLPRNLSQRALVPFGLKLYIPGKIVRTNELLVLVGESQFVETTAFEAQKMVQRRLKIIDDNINAVKIERDEIEQPKLDKVTNDSQKVHEKSQTELDLVLGCAKFAERESMKESDKTVETTTNITDKKERSLQEKQKMIDTVLRSSILADKVAQETGVVNFYEIHDGPDDREPSEVVFPPWWKGGSGQEGVQKGEKKHGAQNDSFIRKPKKVSFAPEAGAAYRGEPRDELSELERETQTREEAIEELRALELEEDAAGHTEDDVMSRKPQSETSFLSGFRKGFLTKKGRHDTRSGLRKDQKRTQNAEESITQSGNVTEPVQVDKTFGNLEVIERNPPTASEKAARSGHRPAVAAAETGSSAKPLSRFKQQRLARMRTRQS